MLRYLGRRLAYALALLLAVVTLNFLLIHISPGDPVETIAGSMGGISEELRPAARAIRAGQALHRAAGAVPGAGVARRPGPFLFLQPAGDAADLGPRAGHAAAGRDLGAGRFPGRHAAGHAGRAQANGPLSQGITLLSIVGYSAPVFWTGILLIILFASMLPIFPVSDMRTAGASELGWSGALDVLHHLVLPACTLGFVYLAQYSRLARASVIEALSADYIRTARAKGLPERTVLYKHALRNGVLPVVTMLGLQFGNVLAGAILVETVFNWPGLGRLAFDSVLRRDYPTLLGILLFASCWWW